MSTWKFRFGAGLLISVFATLGCGKPGENVDSDAGAAVRSDGGTQVGSCTVSSDLDAFIQGRMAATNIPGLAAGLVTTNGLSWAKGYGYADLSINRPIIPDTIFAIMSISKIPPWAFCSGCRPAPSGSIRISIAT